jgi:hypothetical protein
MKKPPETVVFFASELDLTIAVVAARQLELRAPPGFVLLLLGRLGVPRAELIQALLRPEHIHHPVYRTNIHRDSPLTGHS